MSDTTLPPLQTPVEDITPPDRSGLLARVKRIDRVLLVILGLLAVLAVLNWAQAQAFAA